MTRNTLLIHRMYSDILTYTGNHEPQSTQGMHPIPPKDSSWPYVIPSCCLLALRQPSVCFVCTSLHFLESYRNKNIQYVPFYIISVCITILRFIHLLYQYSFIFVTKCIPLYEYTTLLNYLPIARYLDCFPHKTININLLWIFMYKSL